LLWNSATGEGWGVGEGVGVGGWLELGVGTELLGVGQLMRGSRPVCDFPELRLSAEVSAGRTASPPQWLGHPGQLRKVDRLEGSGDR
jgi:hypothetical protein